jgi:hypothetical protein
MLLPEPRTLSLAEAAQLVADRFRVTIEQAQRALDRAFGEYSLTVFDRDSRAIEDWEYTEINWEHSSVARRGPSVFYTIEGVIVFRGHLEDWMATAAPITPGTKLPRRRPGPKRGEVDRYGEADRGLFPELQRMMREENLSSTAAAQKLADLDKVGGDGTKQSKAKRLAERYRHERNSP